MGNSRLFSLKFDYINFLRKIYRDEGLPGNLFFAHVPVFEGYCSGVYPFNVYVGDLDYRSAVGSFVDRVFVSDDIAVCGIVTEYHEMEHAHQNILDLNGQSDDYMMFLNLAYHVGNRNLYLDGYQTNIREIEAERAGVFRAYRKLCDVFPDKDIEGLMLDYVNDRVEHSDYFIAGHYDSMVSVFDAFDVAYEESRLIPQVYHEGNIWYDSPDQIMQICHFDRRTYDRSRWRSVFESFQYDSKNIYDSTKKAACMMYYLHPEYVQRCSWLKNMDLSPETVFGQSFPESSGALRFRVLQSLKRYPGLSFRVDLNAGKNVPIGNDGVLDRLQKSNLTVFENSDGITSDYQYDC